MIIKTVFSYDNKNYFYYHNFFISYFGRTKMTKTTCNGSKSSKRECIINSYSSRTDMS